MAHSTPRPLSIEAIWDKPLVPETGGQAALLVRISGNREALPPLGQRAAVNVAFALDRSGSMTGEKLELAKRAAMTAVERLRPKDRAALVSFDSHVYPGFPLMEMTPGNKRAIKAAIMQIQAGSATNLSGGWLEAANQLAQAMQQDHNRGRVRRVLLLTDGLANNGIVSPHELAIHASALRQRGISTTTLGLGADFDELLLTAMAEAGGGNFQFIEHPAQLPAFFDRELEEMLSVAAPGLSLALHFPAGARVELVNPFPVEQSNGRWLVSIGDLAAGDDVSLVFLVDLPAGRVGSEQGGYVNARWFNRETMTNANHRRDFPALRWTTRAEAERQAVDPMVAEQAALQRVYVEQREAMKLDREGRRAESRQRLHQAADLLAAAPPSPRVAELHDAVFALSEVDASRAYAEEVRKQVHSDAFRRSRKKEA